MAFKIIESIESVSRDAVDLITRLAKTIGDMLFRQRLFAKRLAEGSEDGPYYVGPYTFLGISGFLGAKVISVAAIIALTFNTSLLSEHDTLQYELFSWNQIRQLAGMPEIKTILIFAIPLIFFVKLAGGALRFLLTKNSESKIGEALYYTTGIQYFSILMTQVIAALSVFGDYAAIAASFVSRILIYVIPTVLLSLIVNSAVCGRSRRYGRFFPVVAASVALAFSASTALILEIGALAQMKWMSPNMRDQSLFKVSFIDIEYSEHLPGYDAPPRPNPRQWIRENLISVPIFLTNQGKSEVCISPGTAWVTTEGMPSAIAGHAPSQPMEWKGHIVHPSISDGYLRIAPGAKICIKFEGEKSKDVGLTNEARGKLEVLRVSDDGTLQKVEVYDWE